jgi:hypothetical protein
MRLTPSLSLAAAASAASFASAAMPDPIIYDMVHHNPGEPLTVSQYEDPAVIKSMGYNGKVYFLFDSPTVGIDWEAVDPEIFPKGSPGRKWVDEKAARIDAQHAACKAAGVRVLAMGDLVLFPKTLVAKYKMEKTFGDPRDPQTDKFLRAMVAQMFDRFPLFDGLVVRIGETYLQDAPFHRGHIERKTDPDTTIIPLMQLLREEVCVKRNKQLVFRTWYSFDTNLETYLKVSAAVEPHPNLVISVKHCEGDFHRGNPFSKVLGKGRHRQIVEVQCAREYEGKGAYPNYIAHGVIEGFEEHRLQMPAETMKSIRELSADKSRFAGIWTWSRGGGWFGPFIKNELWCDLNAWVVAQWANDTAQSEEAIFRRYATERLKLSPADADKFRRLCMLSADAVLRGRASTRSDLPPWWTRDDGINRPVLPKNPEALKRVLDEKTESVKFWEEIVALAGSIQFADAKTRDYAIVSSRYGLELYKIYRAIFELEAIGPKGDPAAIKKWLAAYDSAWAEFRKLPASSPQCATLYSEKSAPMGPEGDGIDLVIAPYRKAVQP